MKKITLILLCCILILGCSPTETYTVYDYVLINKASSHKYEIEVKYLHTWQGGNIHMPLDLEKHEAIRSEWIYTNETNGTILPSDFVFTWKKGEPKHPYAMSNVKGHIKITSNILVINIKEPKYENNSNKPIAWENSKFNGAYTIVVNPI